MKCCESEQPCPAATPQPADLARKMLNKVDERVEEHSLFFKSIRISTKTKATFFLAFISLLYYSRIIRSEHLRHNVQSLHFGIKLVAKVW